jgi:serine/threonine protein kinase/Tfp pilus assembly protein PilF
LSSPRQPVGERAGDQIGCYKLLQQIGEGGFGTVWMAEQREPVRRRVALKLIKLGMDTKQVIARFEAERQALALMDHPNIARVFAAGASEAGRPYFAMELVKGVPIVEFCDTQRISTEERLTLFVKVCQAIQHAHHKGVIHRDIKPSNVLITLHDGVPVPKVIDFGVAKAIDQQLTEKTLFTEFRQLIGTPAYMSPEQAEMSGLDIDTRTDVYSLGVLLYELLTGTTPFDAQKLPERGYDEMLRVIREDEPHKPSTRVSTLGAAAADLAAMRQADPRKLGTLLRGDLDWIVMRCLEKDRRRRYETAVALAEDLLRHLQHQPVIAGPPAAGYRLSKFIRRNRRQVIATSLVFCTLILGVIGTTAGMFWARGEQARVSAQTARASEALRHVTTEFKGSLPGSSGERNESVLTSSEGGEVEALAKTAVNLVHSLEASRQETRRELDRANEVKRLIQQMLSSVSPEVALTDDTSLLRGILDQTAARLEAGEISDPAVDAELRTTIGGTYQALGDYEAADPLLQEALEIRRRLLGSDHRDTLKSASLMGVLLFERGELGESEKLIQGALQGLRRLLGRNHPETLNALYNWAILLQLQGKLSEAESACREALKERRNLLGDQHPDTLASVESLSSLLLEQGKPGESEPYHREALEMKRRILGPQHPATLGSMQNMGTLLQIQGKMQEAEPYYIEALQGTRAILDELHPDLLASVQNMGSLLAAQGKLREAEEFYREALLGHRRGLGGDHPDTLTSLANMGILLFRQGQLSEALSQLRQALEGRRRALGEDHFDTLASMQFVGDCLREQGKLGEAEHYQRRSLEGHRRTRGDAHPTTLQCIDHMGLLLGGQGKLDEAEAHHRESLEGSRAVLGDAHPDTLKSMGHLAIVLSQLGRLTEAEPLHREVLARRRALLGNEHPETLAALQNLGIALEQQGKLSEAEPLLLEGLEGQRRVLGNDHPATMGAVQNMGVLMGRLGKLEEAERFYREALEGLRRQLGDHPATLVQLSNMGAILYEQGKLNEAEAYFREALESQRRFLGNDHPDTLNSLLNLGLLLTQQEYLIAAEEVLREAVEGYQSSVSKDHWLRTRTELALADTLRELEFLEEARALASQAHQRSRSRLDWSEEERRMARRILGLVLVDEARSRLSRLEASGDSDRRAAAEVHADLGTGLLLAESYTESERALSQAQTLLLNEGGEDGRWFSLLGILGAAIARQERYAEAEPLLLEAAEQMLSSAGPRSEESPAVDLSGIMSHLIELYERWHQIEPGEGYDQAAASWRSKLMDFEQGRIR